MVLNDEINAAVTTYTDFLARDLALFLSHSFSFNDCIRSILLDMVLIDNLQ